MLIYNANIYSLGFMKAQVTMENGRRWSSDKILYKKPHHTLTVITHAQANKVNSPKKYDFFYLE